MSIRTSNGRVNKVVFRFKVDDKFREIARDGMSFVHDDGIYLCGPLKEGQTSATVVRPLNGNQGMDSGYGDDFGEPLGVVEIPPNATHYIIEVTDENLAIYFEALPERPAPTVLTEKELAPSVLHAAVRTYRKNGMVTVLTQKGERLNVWIVSAAGNLVLGRLSNPWGSLEAGAWVTFGKSFVVGCFTPKQIRDARAAHKKAGK